MEYFTDPIKNFSDFSGRATRKQYWMFILFYMIFYFVLYFIDSMAGTILFTALYSLVLLLPALSLAARRLHDMGKSGWWQLITLVPLIGAIALLVMLCLPSEGDNQYGPAVAT